MDSYEVGAAEGLIAFAMARRSRRTRHRGPVPVHPRLLAVDTAIGFRRHVPVRVVVTSADVLHS